MPTSARTRALFAAALACLVIFAACGGRRATRTVGGWESGSSVTYSSAGPVDFAPANKNAGYESKGEDCGIEVRLACKEEPSWIRFGLSRVVDRQDFELAEGLAYLGEMSVYECGMPNRGDYYPPRAEQLAKREACKQGGDLIVYAGCKAALSEGRDDRILGFDAYSQKVPPVYIWRVYRTEK